MGSPLGPLLADCFMSKLENGILSETVQCFHFYCRYIDNTFIICDSKIRMKLIWIISILHTKPYHSL